MSLGQNIYRLRTQREMSQLSLAEALGVSRQSISKWETDASVPELDKLIKLSQLFSVTLDELVKDEAPSAGRDDPGAPQTDSTKIPPQYIYVKPSRSGRKTAGAILLCMGFLVLLLLSVLGAFAGGLIFASPFIICGLICLCLRRLPGLWCAWALYLFVTLYLQYASGVTWVFALNSYLWKYSELTLQMIVATALLAALIALMLTTAYCLRHPHIDLRQNWKKPLIAAIVIIALRVALYYVTIEVNPALISSGSHFANTAFNALNMWLRTILFTALLTLASRCIRWKR